MKRDCDFDYLVMMLGSDSDQNLVLCRGDLPAGVRNTKILVLL